MKDLFEFINQIKRDQFESKKVINIFLFILKIFSKLNRLERKKLSDLLKEYIDISIEKQEREMRYELESLYRKYNLSKFDLLIISLLDLIGD